MKLACKNSLFSYFAAFFIPAVVLSGIFASLKITPFGDNTLIFFDMNAQYINFFSYYKQMLLGERSLLYTFSKSFGDDGVGHFAYYLASPLNLLLALFKTENLASAVSVLTVLKLSLCGLTSFLFFNKFFKTSYQNLIFSTSYALMSYNIIYSQNIFWIDGVILLPLVITGALEFIDGKKCSMLYIASLALAIFSNYYIAYMVAIFSGLFFLYRLAIVKKIRQFPKPLFYYTANSVLAVTAMSFWILPVISSLKDTSETVEGFSSFVNLASNFSFRMYLTQLIFPVFSAQNIEAGPPNVFVGTLLFTFAIAFLFVPKLALKERLFSLIFFGFMLFSHYFVTLDKMWHGFNGYVWFPFRNSFVTCFLLIYFAARFCRIIGFKNIKIYYLIFILNTFSVVFYAANYFNTMKTQNNFSDFYKANAPLVQKIKATDKGLYRTEKTYLRTLNDGFALNYFGLESYASGEKVQRKLLARKMGYSAVEGYNRYQDGTALAADSFFGVKYILARGLPMPKGLRLINAEKEIEVFENPTALPLIFASKKDIVHLDVEKGNTLETINSVYKAITGISQDILTKESPQEALTGYTKTNSSPYGYAKTGEGSIELTLDAPKDASYYIFNDYVSLLRGEYFVNDTFRNVFLSIDNLGIEHLGQFAKGERIKVSITSPESFETKEIIIFSEDLTVLKRQTADIQKYGIEIERYTEDNIKGKITVPQGKDGLMLTIPFNEGWSLTANGVKTPLTKAAHSLMFAPLPQGTYDIQLKYLPVGYIQGIAISTLSLLAIAGIFYTTKTKEKND